MTSHPIPEEAVKAAALAVAHAHAPTATHSPSHEIWNKLVVDVRLALEAAAPFMRADVLLDTADALDAQPPMLRAQYVAALRLYAAEPWRLTTCPSECAATNHPGVEYEAAQ